MLLAGSRLVDAPVMGLQTGGELARISKPIIDPNNLTIIAYEVDGPLLDIRPSLLRVVDVREFSDIGVIVDSSDEFISPDDVIKLGQIYSLNFTLEGKAVANQKHKKIGKVIGYTIETTGFTIQQLTVRRPLLQSINEPELLIHRSQIIEINDTEIIIQDHAPAPEPVSESVRTAYVNPFRKNAQVEHIRSNDRK